MKKVNRRIILCGCAASGKDYLIEEFVNKGYTKNVSFTSRPKREGEIEGKTYHYISEDSFSKMIKSGDLYEYKEFNNWYYGTTLDSWNNSDIFIMTPSGVNSIKKSDREQSIVIFLDICII